MWKTSKSKLGESTKFGAPMKHPDESAETADSGGMKPRSKWVRFGIPVGAGLLGLIIGTSGSSGAQSELRELRDSHQTLQIQAVDLESTAEIAVKELQTSELKKDELDKINRARTTELEDLKKQVKALTEQVKELEAQLEEAAAAEEAEEAAQFSAPVPFSAPAAPEPAPAPAPSSVYYKNCTAAREAGAAPVYAGDPGYGRHLDRDNDGIGCE